MSNSDSIDAVLTWTKEDKSVEDWFVRKGFSITPIQNGLCIHGKIIQFEGAFSIDFRSAPIALPIPYDLRPNVVSIGFSKAYKKKYLSLVVGENIVSKIETKLSDYEVVELDAMLRKNKLLNDGTKLVVSDNIPPKPERPGLVVFNKSDPPAGR